MNRSQVRKLALSLPEVTEEPHFHRTSYRVRGKIIATAAADEPFLNVMVGEQAREPALATHPNSVQKLFWGKRACGLRVDLRSAKPRLVADLLEQAWHEKAPKSLLSSLE